MKTDSLHQDGVSEHTGFPNAATDRSLATFDLHQFLIKHPVSTFFMRIRGDGWAQDGVHDKDLAIIDRALDPRPIDLVIWWHEGEFMISRFTHVKPGSEVWGVVTTTIHSYR